MYSVAIKPKTDEFSPVSQQIELSALQVEGILCMSECYFGADRDSYVTITDQDGDEVDCDEILDECIIYDQEDIVELEPDDKDWLSQVESLAEETGEDVHFQHKYTLVFTGQKHFLANFDSMEFMSGVYGFCQWTGIHPETHLKHLHRHNEVLTLPPFERGQPSVAN